MGEECHYSRGTLASKQVGTPLSRIHLKELLSCGQTDSAHTGVSNKKIPLDESDGIFLLKVDNRGFRVEIEFTNEVSMGIFSHQPTSEEQLAAVDVAKQCLEIMFKYGLGRTCLSCDTNPQTFFLPVRLSYALKSFHFRPGNSSRYRSPLEFSGTSTKTTRCKIKVAFNLSLE